jgi:hypothetical protein
VSLNNAGTTDTFQAPVFTFWRPMAVTDRQTRRL